MPTLVLGTAGPDTLTAPSGDGTDYKYDAKGGNDVVIGSTGDDLVIGGAGSDYLFGGLGKDTFEFSKFANAGDTDYIVDFKLELGDVLKVFNGATIIGATAEFSGMTEFNGRTLANDPKVYDLTLEIGVVDAGKNFTYTVTLMDVLKNQTYSAAEFNNYLHSLGYNGDIVFADGVA